MLAVYVVVARFWGKSGKYKNLESRRRAVASFIHNGIFLLTPIDKPHYYFGLTASPIFDRDKDHVSINNGTLKTPGLIKFFEAGLVQPLNTPLVELRNCMILLFKNTV